MTHQEIIDYVKAVGSTDQERAKLLGVSITTVRNAIKFRVRLSEKMWNKLEAKIRYIYKLKG